MWFHKRQDTSSLNKKNLSPNLVKCCGTGGAAMRSSPCPSFRWKKYIFQTYQSLIPLYMFLSSPALIMRYTKQYWLMKHLCLVKQLWLQQNKIVEFVVYSFCFVNDHVNACNMLRVGVVWVVAVRFNCEWGT